MSLRHGHGLLWVLALAVVLAFGLSLMIGVASAPLAAQWRALMLGDDPALTLVMQQIRLPRSLLALMIGATLGLSGAALQGYLRNPLAEPGVIGVSATAALFAVVAIYSGITLLVPLALPLAGLAGAGLAALLLLAIGRNGPVSLILGGVALTTLAGAFTSLALNLSGNPYAATEIIFWMMGSVADRSMEHVRLAAPFMVLGWIMLMGAGRGLDALTLGEGAAASMGIRLRRLQGLVVLGTSLSVGAATAVAGAIGFVGLVVPHLLRPLVGALPSRLLPVSALGGALLLLLADIGLRWFAPHADLKLGVLTALIGAPLFIWIARRHDLMGAP